MPETPLSIDALLERMVGLNASDLHITVGSPPVVRVHGTLQPLEGTEPLAPDQTHQLLYRILSTEQQKTLEVKRQIDMAHSIPGLARFRVNVYFQRETLGAAFRLIPAEIKTLEELGIPSTLHVLTEKPRGLVLVTGPTGSGKSTTPAAVILLGEMRDLETIGTAITAAETGHLVFATLHTQSAPSTVDRIIDAFPGAQQEQVRVQLAGTLEGIVTQALLKTSDGAGRVAALEILYPDEAVRNLIRQGKVEQIYSVMQTGTSKGMQTMEQALADLTLRRIITLQTALSRSSRPDQLFGLLQRSGYDVGEAGGALAEEDGAGAPLAGGLRLAGA